MKILTVLIKNLSILSLPQATGLQLKRKEGFGVWGRVGYSLDIVCLLTICLLSCLKGLLLLLDVSVNSDVSENSNISWNVDVSENSDVLENSDVSSWDIE